MPALAAIASIGEGGPRAWSGAQPHSTNKQCLSSCNFSREHFVRGGGPPPTASKLRFARSTRLPPTLSRRDNRRKAPRSPSTQDRASERELGGQLNESWRGG